MIEIKGESIMEIKQITKLEGSKIIVNFQPVGLFIFKEDDSYIGIDNSTGDCWVEEFITEDLCMKWLKGEIEMSDLELDI